MPAPSNTKVFYDYPDSSAQAVGPAVFEQPFALDDGRYVFRQKWHQYCGPYPADYTPVARGTAHPDGTNFAGFYLHDQGTPNHLGGGILEFDREYASKPATRIEFDNIVHAYLDFVLASGVYTVYELPSVVQMRTVYKYFRIAPGGGGDYTSADQIPVFSELKYIQAGTILTGLGSVFPLENLAIAGATAANPCVINAVAHGFPDGIQVGIAGRTGSTPDINGKWFITVIDADHFSIPVNVTVSGSSGTVQTAESLHGDAVPKFWKAGFYEQAFHFVKKFSIRTVTPP